MDELKKYIREVPDFPKPGILFYDVPAIFKNPEGFKIVLDQMAEFIREQNGNKLIAVESRGFVIGGALADRLNLQMELARKPGKLPYKTISEEYELEYGTDKLEMHIDAVEKGDRVIIIDDLLATGGTVQATCKLVEQLGGIVAGIAVIVDLSFLPWREKLANYKVKYLVSYDSE